MAHIKKLTERQLTKLVKRVVREEETAGSEVLSAQDRELSWGKLREFLKDMYVNYKQTFADVQPNEFNEIEMVLSGLIDLAKNKNINNKDASVITQYLKQHVKPLERQYDASQKDTTPDAPAKPKYAEVNENYGKRSNYNRLYKRLKDN